MGAASSSASGANLSELERAWTERRMAASDTAEQEEAERDRRVASGYVAPREMDQRLSEMQSELLRHVGRALARAVADQERADRVAAEAARIGGLEMEREAAITLAIKLMEAERDARMKEPRPELSRRMQLIHIALHELFRFRTLRADVAGEFLSRCQSDQLQLRVLPQLLRTVNGRWASAAMDAEMVFFAARHSFASVLDQLRWRVGRRSTTAAARLAQIELVEAGFTLPGYIEEAKLACNTLIDRRGQVASVTLLAEREREHRVVRARLFAVCEHVRRRMAQREAVRLTNDERAQRLATERFFEVLEDLTRLANRKAVATQVLAEPRRAPRSVPMPLLMRQQIHDHHATRVVRAACQERQSELMQRWRMFEVIQEIDHVFGGRAALAASLAGQAERIHALRFEPVMAALRSAAARKEARDLCQAEQVRRVVLGPSFTAKYQLRRCLAELLGDSQRHRTAEAARDLLAEHKHHFVMRDVVLPQLVRRVVRPVVALQAAEAQGQRIAADRMQRLVLPQLHARFARQAVREAVQRQQLQAVPTPAPGIRLNKELVNEAIRRRSSKQASQEVLELNINKHRFARVVDDLLHRGNRRNAALVTAMEQHERVHADRMRLVRNELQCSLESMMSSLLSFSGRSEAVDRFAAVPEAHRAQVAHVRSAIENLAK